MSNPPQILAPAGFVPEHAVAFAAPDGSAVSVAATSPLPTRPVVSAAQSTPLAGSSAASVTVGPFAPDLGRAIWVSLSGTWTGSVQLLRSTDGGFTRLPITYADGSPKGGWTGNVNAAVTEETVAGARYWLALSPASGTIAYEVRQ